MPTSTISNNLGAANAGINVTARLRPFPGFRISDSSSAPDTYTTTADASGAWSLALEEQANITPWGTYYEIEEERTLANGGPLIRAAVVGANNATLMASLVTPPTGSIPTTASLLTQATGDARYLLTGAFLPVTADGLQYVTAGGSDANSGLSWGAAKATLAAAQTALPAGGGIIMCGKGSFAGQFLFDRSNVLVIGMGRELTKIVYTGASYAVGNSDPTTRRDRVGMAYLTVDCTGGLNGVIGLQVNNFQRCVWRDVWLNCGTATNSIALQFVGSVAKSTYFNDFYEVDCTATLVCHDYGDQCNAERFFGGVLDGNTAIAIRANPGTTTTGTNTYNQVAIQTGNATLMDFGSGAAQVSNWSFTDCRLEPVSTATIQIGANATNINFKGGSWSNDVQISCRTTSGCMFDIPMIGLYRRDSYAVPNDGVLPTDVGGYRPISQTMHRNHHLTDEAILSDGRLHMMLIYLHKGQTILRVGFYAGATALGTGVNQWCAVFTSARVKVAISDDDGATAWAANARKLFVFSTPYTPQTSGYYYLGLMVNISAGNLPSLVGGTHPNAVIAGETPVMSGYADTGLTNPASCPSTAAAITATANMPYAVVLG